MHTFRRRRRGVIYLLVLGTATLVSLLSMAGIMALRVQRKATLGDSDAVEARLYAQAAVEMGMQLATQNVNWRTTYTNGAWFTNQPIGDGTYSLTGIDPTDGDLADSNNDTLVLTGTGVKGQATQKLQVTVFPKAKGLSCLEVAMDAGGSIDLNDTDVAGGTISANGSIVADGADVDANVEAVGAITGDDYNQTVTTPITARVLPQTSTVFNYYIANGTAISLSSIPLQSSVRTVDMVLISPNSNPYGGATNPKGIYIIDCANGPFRIKDCRIVGTLVLLNCYSAGQVVTDSVNWEPAVSNYPVLMVQGGIMLDIKSSDLDENSGGKCNFNPPGTPYNAQTDNDKSDKYPSEIKGIVYVSGDLLLNENPKFKGVVVAGGNISSEKDLTLQYDDKYFNDAPPGFTAATQMLIMPATFQRMVN